MTDESNASLGYERMPMSVGKGRAYQKRFAKFLAQGGWEIESTGGTEQAMGFGKQTYMLRRVITPDSPKGQQILYQRQLAAEQAEKDRQRAVEKAEKDQQRAEAKAVKRQLGKEHKAEAKAARARQKEQRRALKGSDEA